MRVNEILRWLLAFVSLTVFLLISVSVSSAQDEEEEDEVAVGERPVLQVGALSPVRLARDNIEQIISIIKQSENLEAAQENLMNRFQLSAAQANSIMNMRLQRLTGIDRTNIDFHFDGKLSERAWLAAGDSISNLITIEPEEGGTPEGRTVVKVLTTQEEILIAAYCYDNDPDGIVSFSKARDTELDEEDHIVIILDTFMDGRSGYVFAVNPSGARFDGLVIEHGEDVNSDWDAVWQAKTSRDAYGWYAEIRIPVKSLSFKKNSNEWGFNVQRRVERLQETSRWSGASLDFEIYQSSRAGVLTGLPEFDLGVGMSVRASLVGSGRTPESGADTEYDGDLSLDITQRIGSNLQSAFTVNTDFAETEVDVRQINLTRFPLFFPEKRSFFLQGADIFEFGVGLDEDTMIPFFSRRIGLTGRGEDDLVQIPIDFGGKINGRVGNTNIAALVVNTRAVDSLDIGDVDEEINIHVPDATMGAVRINQNILEESSIGVLGTFGDQLGRTNSWSAGVDFTYRTSNFMNEKNFLVSLWALRNDREDLEGDKGAYGFRIDYPNELFDINLSSIRIGDGFNPSLAFVPRNDIHLWSFTGEFRPRPSWELVRQMTYEVAYRQFNNLDNSQWESYELDVIPFNWLLESGDSFDAGLQFGGDRPPESFEIASGVDVPSVAFAGDYQWNRFVTGAHLAGKRAISGDIIWEFGDYYNGDLSTIEGRLALKPSSFLTLEFTGERNTGKALALPEDVDEEDADELEWTDFTEELVGVRLLLNFSPDLQLSSLTQYDTQSKELGTNTRLRWTFDPLGDIFIVYNHNVVRRTEEKRWEFISNEFPIKIQYALRF